MAKVDKIYKISEKFQRKYENIGKPFDINHAYKIVSMNKNKIFSQACFVSKNRCDDLKFTKIHFKFDSKWN